LFVLRESLFGRGVAALADCPACSNRMEVSFNVGDVLLPSPSSERAVAGASPGSGATPLAFAEQGYEIQVRLPNSTDLMALRVISDAAATDERMEPKQYLLSRCLLEAKLAGESVSADALPEAVRNAISQRMADADPQAQVALKLECDGCGHEWHDDFRIDSFLWGEIQAWAARLVNEVHQLACAYGWSENQILELGPLRRNLYLNLIAE
jgi:hypothetical protein